MSPCAATRPLLAAMLVGMAVATVWGSDAWGWVAAGVAATLVAVVGRRVDGGGSCAVPAAPSRDDAAR